MQNQITDQNKLVNSNVYSVQQINGGG